ncbi:MAG: ATP-dependent DNA helicase RecG [Candidatus Wallbacteria bacterium]|nr:ATP-dependent DNA helicase RecG [Candidatus Wallbacteria bacterium]
MLPYSESEFYRKELRYLKGIGPKRCLLFKNLGIETCGDLLYHQPLRHQDRSLTVKIAYAAENEESLFILTILSNKTRRIGRRMLLELRATDDSGWVQLVFFNRNFLAEKLKPGDRVSAFGKLETHAGRLQITHPELEMLEKGEEVSGRIVPIYPLTDGLNQRLVRKCMETLLELRPGEQDLLPPEISAAQLLIEYDLALRNLHFPKSLVLAEAAKRRLVFEELFYFQLGILYNRSRMQKESSPSLSSAGELEGRLRQKLGFELTVSQETARAEILKSISLTRPMRTLLQGDVGSGKTVVSLIAALHAIESGYQAAFLAPTEVLAEQHYLKISQMLGDVIEVGLLTGSIRGVENSEIKEKIRSGKLKLLIGTHALLEEDVEFSKLGLAVIDEQHRFGVAQREKFVNKGRQPHLLVMTATPIPRTLTLTIYGELDVVYLRELPHGRRKIKTVVRTPEALPRVYDFIREEVGHGNRAYLVCPLIEESEKLTLSHVTGLFEELKRGSFKNCRLGLLHGRMKASEKEGVMDRFRSGEIEILVSTTVIEVGVDVPEATVMVVYDAERFGISQLHQLRGRVGRSDLQSYAVLVSENLQSERLQALVNSSDGFELAETDLRIRGPGEFLGNRQHGRLDFKFADIMRDREILLQSIEAARNYLSTDPDGTRLSPVLKEFLLRKYHCFHDRMG